MPCRSDIIYTAGYLDGEGCFSAYDGMRFSVCASNTYKPTLNWLKKIWGGNVVKNIDRRGGNRRQVYMWYVCGDNAINLCNKIIPFSKEKLAQAKIIVKLGKLRKSRGNHKLLPSVKFKRDKLCLEIKRLKRISY